MLLSEAIDKFIAANRHRWAEVSSVWYRQQVNSLLRYLGDVHVETITAEDLGDWMYWQVAEKEYADSTRVGFHLAVSLMFKYLAEKEVVENHFAKPSNHLNRPKIREQVQPKAKHSVVFALLDFIEREALGYLERKSYTAYKTAKRDLAIFWLMISTGCRRVEVKRLQMKDFQIQTSEDGQTGIIRFIGKGMKQRRNYIAEKPLEAMENWLAVRLDPNSDHDRLFLSTKPRNGVYFPLGERTVNTRICYWAKKGGFEDETLNPHSFRRAYATYAVSKGVPITVVQKQLGHADIKTTMRYIKHDEEALIAQSKRLINVLGHEWESRE